MRVGDGPLPDLLVALDAPPSLVALARPGLHPPAAAVQAAGVRTALVAQLALEPADAGALAGDLREGTR